MILRTILIGLLLTGFSMPAVRAQELTEEQKSALAEKIRAGISAAEEWLRLVDDEKYSASWEQSASFFKERVPDGQWETTLRQVRSPLGKTKSREVLKYQYATSLPGVPQGEYVVIQFKTSFDEKADAVETITPMMDADGQWRVSGYYIR